MILEIIIQIITNWESGNKRIKHMDVAKNHMTIDQKEFPIRKIPH